jgi:putative alpha-1,2-mannosidase
VSGPCESYCPNLSNFSLAASRVGHLRFTFNHTGNFTPGVVVQATRAYVLGSSDPTNLTFPIGDVQIDLESREVSGRNPERQDHIIGPSNATSFAGSFVARFDQPFASFGTASNATLFANESQRTDKQVSAFVNFAADTKVVNMRVGVSFISIDQARRNLDNEIPNGQSLESTAKATRSLWAEKLDRIQVEGGSTSNKTTFYTAFFHSLQVCHPFPAPVTPEC